MRFLTRHLIAILAAAIVIGPAHATVVYSISGPSDVSPGDTNDVFDVLISNTGPSSLNIAAFAFQVFADDTDITLNSADTSPTADPYILAGDSFDDANGFTLNVPNPNIPPQTLSAIDVTNLFDNVTLGSGDTLSLGEVFFSVAPGATPGPFAVGFGCLVYYDPATTAPPNGVVSQPAADCNNLSDETGTAVNVDEMDGAQITVQPSGVPEPATLVSTLAGFVLAAGVKRKRQR